MKTKTILVGLLLAATAFAQQQPSRARLTSPGSSFSGSASGTNTGDQLETCPGSQWLSVLAATTTSTCSQPNFTDLAGAVAPAQLPCAGAGVSGAACNSGGVFAFDAGMVIGGTLQIATAGTGTGVGFLSTNGLGAGILGLGIASNYVQLWGSGGTSPNVTNTFVLGTPSLRWSSVASVLLDVSGAATFGSTVAATGAVTGSNLSGTNTGDQTSVSGNAGTATALAANPTDCSANQFATTIAASGNLSCAQPAFTDVTGTATIAQGGTNSTASPTAGGVGYGTGSAHAYNSAGTAAQCLLSGGAGAPTWGSCSSATQPNSAMAHPVGLETSTGRQTAWWSKNDTTTTTVLNTGGSIKTQSASTAAPAATGATRDYWQFATTNGVVAGQLWVAATRTRPLYRPRYSVMMLTAATITGRQLSYGVWNQDISTAAPPTTAIACTSWTGVACRGAGIMYRSTVSANWLCVTGDGTDVSGSDIGVAVATSTEYRVVVDWTTAGTVRCCVNGTCINKTSNLDATTSTGLDTHATGSGTTGTDADGWYLATSSLEQN